MKLLQNNSDGLMTTLQEASWAARQLAGDGELRLSESAMAVLASALREEKLERGQRLYGSGDDPPGAWILRTATAELSAYEGKRRSIIQLIHPGEVVGDVPVLLHEPSPITVRVASGGVALFVESDALRSMLKSEAELTYLWLRGCAQRLQALRLRLIRLRGGSLPQVLAKLLLDEAAGDRVLLSQARMADMLGARRTSVNRALRGLRETGVIEVVYSGVVLKDPAALERVAAGPDASVEAHTGA